MSLFEYIWNLAFHWLSDPHDTPPKVTLCFTVDPRIAEMALPLVKRLLADGTEGNTYRTKLSKWHERWQRPVDVYNGRSHFCWIENPKSLDDYGTTLCGLIIGPNVKAFLDPFDAQNLRDHMTAAVDKTIAKWISKHNIPKGTPFQIPVATVSYGPHAAEAREQNVRPRPPTNGGFGGASDTWGIDRMRDPDNA